MPKYLGQSFADKLSELKGLPPEDNEVVAYGLEYLLTGALGVALTLLTAFILGLLVETLAVIFCWGIMRLFAGGAHCKTVWRCTGVSFIAIISAVLLSRGIVLLIQVELLTWIAVPWALLATWIWAPNNSERPVRNPIKRRILRRRALILITAVGAALFYKSFSGNEYLQLQAAAGSIGLAAGAFLLSPPGFMMVNGSEKMIDLLHQIFNKGGEIQ